VREVASRESFPRTGIGFDVHRFGPGRPLMLGGLRFDDGTPGLEGHSDGDVVCHALADAILGAAALGDVGEHLPDTDPTVAGISGVELLVRMRGIVASSAFEPVSCDVTVICERPAIAPRRDEMRACLAAALDVEIAEVSVKATRPEGLGLVGDGIGCLAVAVLR
jgi:2-C-methyl-D-erythritol 2,4-cyclodiphosphate synthase